MYLNTGNEFEGAYLANQSFIPINRNMPRLFKLVVITTIILSSVVVRLYAQQNETFTTGSYIINMGATSPNTVGNGLKPYGLVYDLIRNYSVPVRWVIGTGKVKDGVDFTYNSTAYRGGTFIIPKEFRSTAVNSRITYWESLGVTGTTTNSTLTVFVNYVLNTVPRWTIDNANGHHVSGYLNNAGITTTAFSGAYNFKKTSELDQCDDFYSIPHAFPKWNNDANLYTWMNSSRKASLWAACHTVSAMENAYNPSNTSQQMNFLMQKSNLATGSYAVNWAGNTAVLWKDHTVGTPPYTSRIFDDPMSQYMGGIDEAHFNGPGQVFIPKQVNGSTTASRWNANAKILTYDPSHGGVPTPDLANGNVAAIVVYGRAYDNDNLGWVMYQAGHKLTTTSAPHVAGQRAYLNFSFFQALDKKATITVTGITNGGQITKNNAITLTASATSVMYPTGTGMTYQWSSTCNGTFSAATSSTTTFTPTTSGTCVITCKATDACGRVTFETFTVTVTESTSPTAVNDVASITSACYSPGTSTTINVLSNDSDPDNNLNTTSVVLVNPLNPNQTGTSYTISGNGTWTTNGTTVTFAPIDNFFSTSTITYKVFDQTAPTPLSASATVSVSVGTADGNGCMPGTVYGVNTETGATTASQLVSTVNNYASATGLADFDETDVANTAAEITNTSGELKLDYGSTLTDKDSISLYFATSASNNAACTISASYSTDGTNWTSLTLKAGSQTSPATKYQIETAVYDFPAGGLRYIRVKTSTGNALIDAVILEDWSCVSAQVVANDDQEYTNEDIAHNIEVLSNDDNPGNLPLRLTISQQPSHGKVSINIDNTITYINTTDYSGTDQFTYKICNNKGFCDEGIVTITIADDLCSAGQYKPLSSSTITKTFSSSTESIDTYIDKLSSSTNYENNSSSLQIGKRLTTKARRIIWAPVGYTDASGIPSTAVIESATFALKQTGGRNATFTLNTVIYRLTEAWTENQATWNNRTTSTAWTTAGGTYTSTVYAAQSITRNGNNSNGNVITYDVKTLVDYWQANRSNASLGLVLVHTNDKVDKEIQFGSSEDNTSANNPKLTIVYRTSDPCTALVNRAPLAMPDDFSTTTNTALSISNALTNDSDPDGNSLSITAASCVTTTLGTISLSGNVITYTPNNSRTIPRTDTLKYTISDGTLTDEAYIFVSVLDAGISANKDVTTINSNAGATSISVLTNDSDPEGQSFSAPTITVSPKRGTASVSGNNIIYTPSSNFSGNDTLVYSITENSAATCVANASSDTALVVITVTNQTPTAVADSKSILTCQTAVVNLITNDTDPENGVLTVNIVTGPASGTLVNNNDGTVSYTPATNFVTPGSVTFTYTVTDNGVPAKTSSAATVTISIASATNNAPVANTDIADPSVNGEDVFVSILDNDTDADGNEFSIPTLAITTNPLHGIASILSNGMIFYTPTADFTGKDSLIYRVYDIVQDGSCVSATGLSDTAKVIFTMVTVNSTVAVNDEISTWVNKAASGSFLTNDFDPQGNYPLTFNGIFLPNTVLPKLATSLQTSGSYTLSGTKLDGTTSANAGSISVNAAGTFTFTPASGFVGVVNLYYAIQDAATTDNAKDTALISITVVPLPNTNSVVANNDEGVTLPNTSLTSNVFPNDDDPDNSHTFSITSFKYSTRSSGSLDGDGALNRTSGRLNTLNTIGGTSITGEWVANAGTITINSTTGAYTFTPAIDFWGTVEITYTITDPQGATSTAILVIKVVPDRNGANNDPPVATDDFQIVTYNTVYTSTAATNVLVNDKDPNGDPLLVTAQTTTNSGGTLNLLADGSYTYTPATNFTGYTSYNYQISDNGTGLTAEAKLGFLIDDPTALPVTGMVLAANLSQKIVTLTWKTETEINTSSFVIERSFDNIKFESIGQLGAAGNSGTTRNYRFVNNLSDVILSTNFVFYRIRQVDLDGKFTYSNIAVVKPPFEEGVKVWPNPFQSSLTLSIGSGTYKTYVFTLTDANGKLIRQIKQEVMPGPTQITWHGLEALSAGTYFIEIHDLFTNQRAVQKVTKIR